LISSEPIPVVAALRIIYIIDEMEAITSGGTERQILQMISLMEASGHSLQLAILRGTSWLTPELAGCPITFFQFRRLASISGMREWFRLVRWLRSQRPDVVQTFFVESSLIGPLAAKCAGVPTVIGSRRNLNWWMTPKLVIAQRFANLFTTRLLANCEAVKAVVVQTEGVNSDKVDVVYNGVDTARFAPSESVRERTRAALGFLHEHVVIGSTATLRPMKGLEPFLEAAARIHRVHPHARFLIVGDGPLRAKVEQIIAAAGLQTACVLVGSQQDMVPYLQSMDIGVLASESEGFSNSILEYLAAGVPCVASDVGGNREAIGNAGSLFPINDVAVLTDILIDVVEDSNLRQALSRRALQHAGRFDLESVRRTLADYYQRLAKR